MSRRPRESESESESEAEAEAPLRLDEPLAEEGLQDIDFDFDDPQERHAPSILGLLRKHPLADVAPRPALAALADLLAGDPRSVGTVVGSGGGDDLIGFVAAVDLADVLPFSFKNRINFATAVYDGARYLYLISGIGDDMKPPVAAFVRYDTSVPLRSGTSWRLVDAQQQAIGWACRL